MKIDLLYEIQMPEPWDSPDAEYRKFWETIEQIELADRAGFGTVWFVEFQRLLCLMQVGHLSHEAIMRWLQLFGDHVIPHFKSKAKVAAR